MLAPQSVVAFSGAGTSAESGIATFRGDAGLWKRYNPSLYGNIPGLAVAFLLNPAKVLRFGVDVLEAFLAADPNPAHRALGRLEALGPLRSVITQNIDTLHEKGGNTRVIKLHGDIARLRCRSCERRFPLEGEEIESILEALRRMPAARLRIFSRLREAVGPCPDCGGFRRPDVVFFGEGLPREELNAAMADAATCKVMLVVGTSGLVYPAAQIPHIAKQAGVFLVEVNPEPSPLSPIADARLVGPAGTILRALAERVESLLGRPPVAPIASAS